VGTDLCKIPLFGQWESVVEVFSDNEAEDGIAKEFEPLVRVVRLARTLEEDR